MARTLHRLIALAVVATTSAFLPQGPRKAPCAALKSVADKAAATVPIAVEAGDAPSVAAWRAACDETGVVSFHDFGLRVGEYSSSIVKKDAPTGNVRQTRVPL